MALTAQSPDEFPQNWAASKSNLGDVLLALAENETSNDHLWEAAAQYWDIARVYTPEVDPAYHAAMQARAQHCLDLIKKRGG